VGEQPGVERGRWALSHADWYVGTAKAQAWALQKPSLNHRLNRSLVAESLENLSEVTGIHQSGEHLGHASMPGARTISPSEHQK
jgi:hypothetical protein